MLNDDLSDVNERIEHGFDAFGLVDNGFDNWEQGSIYEASGENNPYWPKRLRTKNYISVSTGDTFLFISDSNTIMLLVFCYSTNSYVGRSGNIVNGSTYTVPNEVTRIRFMVYDTTETVTKFDLLKHINIFGSYANNIYKFLCAGGYAGAISTNINVTSSNTSSYLDADSFPNRTIINVSASAANVAHKPFDSCTIITTGFSITNITPYGGSKQIAINNVNGAIAIRSNNGINWCEWTYTEHVFTADNTNFIEVIEKALLTTNATVILESGTYNMFDTIHNEAYWKSKRPATRYCGINLKNGIRIVADGIVNFDANYTGSDEDIKENFSVFNIAGSCEIRNININASNICYLVHDDPRIVSNQNNSCIIHGCKLIHNGTNHTFTSGAPMCIGAGESNNSYREYTDNVIDSTYDRSVNVHTATGGKGKYIIIGNYFIKGTLGFTAFGDGTGRIEGIVSNNSLPSDIVNSSSGASTPYTFNNVIRS